MTQPSLTGRGPRRRTRRSVRVAERVAKTMITIGGVGTILAVSLIMAFLLWVVVPLFTQSDAQVRAAVPQFVKPRRRGQRPQLMLIDASGAMRASMAGYLRGRGFDVIDHGTCEAALRELRAQFQADVDTLRTLGSA